MPLAFGLAACTDCGSGGLDAGLDAPDARDASDARDTGGELELVLEPGPYYDEGCADWEVTTSPARALPADSTPRELWRWSPGDHPELVEFNPAVHSVSLSPSGGIYVTFGVGFDRVARLGAEGDLEWTTDLPEQILRPLVMLPDGRFLALTGSGAVFTDPTAAWRVFRRNGDGTSDGALDLAGGRGLLSAAVGPRGRVYFANGNRIVATCAGVGGIVWTLQASDPDMWWDELWVETDGSVLATSGYRVLTAPVRISPAGEVHAIDDLPEPVPPGWSGYVRRMGATRAAGVWSNDARAREYVARIDGSWATVPNDGSSRVLSTTLDPASGLWSFSGARALSRIVDGEVVHTHVRGELECLLQSAPYEDGSLICYNVDLRRVSPVDGEDLWVLQPLVDGNPLAIGSLVVDRSGRVYGTTSMGLFAYQTDALPPDVEDGCALPALGCNERHDGASSRWEN